MISWRVSQPRAWEGFPPRPAAREALSPARPFARSSRRRATPPPTSGEGWWGKARSAGDGSARAEKHHAEDAETKREDAENRCRSLHPLRFALRLCVKPGLVRSPGGRGLELQPAPGRLPVPWAVGDGALVAAAAVAE